MSRARKPASLKKGTSETKKQLKIREQIEESLKGKDDKLAEAPSFFTEEEKTYYTWLLGELSHLNILSNIDAPLLQQTANVLYTMFLAEEEIRKNGILIKDYDKYGNEKLRQNPAIKIKLDYQTKYAALCNQLGLSPASRAAISGKIMQDKAEAEDPVLKLLKGGIN